MTATTGPARSARRTARASALLLAALALALSGCIRVEFAIRVDEDGSSSFSGILAYGDALAAMAGDAAGELIDGSGLPDGASVEEYRADGYRGIRFTMSGEVADLIEGVATAGPDGGGPFDSFDLLREGDEWIFDAVLRPLGEAAPDGGGGLDALGAGLAESLFADGWFRVRLELPGEIVDHNADRIEDGALVWEIDLQSQEARSLFARTDAGGGADATPVVVSAVIAAALVALIAWIAVRRRARARA